MQGSPDRLEARDVAKLLFVSLATARRRLTAWCAATLRADRDGTPLTEPRTVLAPDPTRRGRSAYTTTRAELARAYPEIDDG